MNKIIFIDHLGRDPEMRYTPNGQGGYDDDQGGSGLLRVDSMRVYGRNAGNPTAPILP